MEGRELFIRYPEYIVEFPTELKKGTPATYKAESVTLKRWVCGAVLSWTRDITVTFSGYNTTGTATNSSRGSGNVLTQIFCPPSGSWIHNLKVFSRLKSGDNNASPLPYTGSFKLQGWIILIATLGSLLELLVNIYGKTYGCWSNSCVRPSCLQLLHYKLCTQCIW